MTKLRIPFHNFTNELKNKTHFETYLYVQYIITISLMSPERIKHELLICTLNTGQAFQFFFLNVGLTVCRELCIQ
jgi:hypothetical protein